VAVVEAGSMVEAGEDFTGAGEHFTAEATPATVAGVTTEAIVEADTTAAIVEADITVIAVATGTGGVADIGVTRATVTDGDGDSDMVGVGRIGGDTHTRIATALGRVLPTPTIIRTLVHLAMLVPMVETETTILRRQIPARDPTAILRRTALPTRTTRPAAKQLSRMLRFSPLTGLRPRRVTTESHSQPH
jgi:hypothetical protein